MGVPDDLLALALSRPAEALAAALRVLDAHPAPAAASIAHQAAGIVLRDFGDIDAAVTHLRSAARLGRLAGDPERAADARASLGVALVMIGQPRRGLTMLDSVVRQCGPGVPAARHLVRRSHVLWLLGRNDEALDDARQAVDHLRGTEEAIWLARAYNHCAMAHLAMGDVERADRNYARCEVLYARTGQQLELATVRQERGAAAFARGDLPTALTYFDDARRRVDELGVFEPELVVNKCAALLAAGLAQEALTEADAAVARIESLSGSATRRAELLHTAAVAAYETGAVDVAERRCLAALTLFRRQQRRLWAARTELVLVQCRSTRDERSAALIRRARHLVSEFDELSPERAVEAHLIAGRLALAGNRPEEARRQLTAAARDRNRVSRTSAAAWLAQAVLCELDGRWRAMLRACDRGLRSLEVPLNTAGSTELRVLATAQRAALVQLAMRCAARRDDPELLLGWGDRGRATVLSVPPVRAPRDPQLETDLVALRGLAHRLDVGDHAEQAVAVLRRERRRLEVAVRERVLRTPGTAVTESPLLRVAELREHLGDNHLIQLVDVDGTLHAVVAGRETLDSCVVGPTSAAEFSVAHALFALRRRLARATPRGGVDLDLIGARLQQDLLGGAAELLRDGPAVIVPTSRLHAVPWNLLPALRDRPTTVVPSAGTWLRARRTDPPPDARVVLIGGPQLSTGAEEVRRLAKQYPEALVLTDGEATVDRVLEALDGAWLAHLTAHGTFRADSPFFSALQLDDGPLTVYDFERLGRAPHRVVLSSCNSAVGAPSGADELIGLVSALFALGSVGVVASVVPVDDPATVPLMLALHEQLRAGGSLAEAMQVARRSVRADPKGRAAADSFLALGV